MTLISIPHVILLQFCNYFCKNFCSFVNLKQINNNNNNNNNHIAYAVRVNLQLPECQKTPCPTQAQYLKFKWLQWNSNHNCLVRINKHSKHLAKLAQRFSRVVSTYMYGALPLCFYHNAFAFRMNLHPVTDWMSRNSLLETGNILNLIGN